VQFVTDPIKCNWVVRVEHLFDTFDQLIDVCRQFQPLLNALDRGKKAKIQNFCVGGIGQLFLYMEQPLIVRNRCLLPRCIALGEMNRRIVIQTNTVSRVAKTHILVVFFQCGLDVICTLPNNVVIAMKTVNCSQMVRR
jgi:hypothetical protein